MAQYLWKVTYIGRNPNVPAGGSVEIATGAKFTKPTVPQMQAAFAQKYGDKAKGMGFPSWDVRIEPLF